MTVKRMSFSEYNERTLSEITCSMADDSRLAGIDGIDIYSLVCKGHTLLGSREGLLFLRKNRPSEAHAVQ